MFSLWDRSFPIALSLIFPLLMFWLPETLALGWSVKLPMTVLTSDRGEHPSVGVIISPKGSSPYTGQQAVNIRLSSGQLSGRILDVIDRFGLLPDLDTLRAMIAQQRAAQATSTPTPAPSEAPSGG